MPILCDSSDCLGPPNSFDNISEGERSSFVCSKDTKFLIITCSARQSLRMPWRCCTSYSCYFSSPPLSSCSSSSSLGGSESLRGCRSFTKTTSTTDSQGMFPNSDQLFFLCGFMFKCSIFFFLNAGIWSFCWM